MEAVNTDEFPEKIQTDFDTPPPFLQLFSILQISANVLIERFFGIFSC